jgi:hypothetical protein
VNLFAVLVLAKTPVQLGRVTVYREFKRPDREADTHSSSVQVQNAWNYSPVPTCGYMAYTRTV